MSRFTPRVEITGTNSYITVHPIDGKHSATLVLMLLMMLMICCYDDVNDDDCD